MTLNEKTLNIHEVVPGEFMEWRAKKMVVLELNVIKNNETRGILLLL